MGFLHTLLILLLAAMPPAARAATPESEVRAAIVVSFSNYVEWPASNAPSNTVQVCIAGRGPTADALMALNGKTIFGRNIIVAIRFHPVETMGCHILFIGESSMRSPQDWLRETAGLPLLTVVEGEGLPLPGSIINLARSGKRIVFDIDLTSMRRANLLISSDLLRLARELHGR